jgi:hypothetical protein
MKSLRALLIVVFAGAGMIVSLWMLMNYRWPNREIRAQFEDLTPAQVMRVDIKGEVPNGVIAINDPAEIGRIINAFKLADRPRADHTKSVSAVFIFRDEKPPLKYDFGSKTVESDLGKAVADVLNPYLRPTAVQN